MPIIRNIKTKQKKNGTSYQVTVTVGEDTTNSVKTVDVYIPAVSGQPDPEPENVTLNYSGTSGEDRIFSYEDLGFSSNAAGLTYEMTATMKNNTGGTIGTPVAEPVLVEEYNEEA
ncbi:hypothetical protein [Aureispira anguillae]|uniref:Uncharacterized protein n=1 Tax=Aureispira anguillae TaxID=2864201 RepID=A0A915YFJ5_9BACT|nr:hypothetical protein [Aureispira anguillae]BDS12105.1 hypothetical protein AsAng_0028200 [Aureispira anguillae]